jgi:acyl-CoA hydrolase
MPFVPVEVDEILFRKPVDVADLIQFKATVLHTWQSGRDPTKVGVYA